MWLYYNHWEPKEPARVELHEKVQSRHSCLSATESVKVRSVMLALQSFLITMVLKCMLWIIEVCFLLIFVDSC